MSRSIYNEELAWEMQPQKGGRETMDHYKTLVHLLLQTGTIVGLLGFLFVLSLSKFSPTKNKSKNSTLPEPYGAWPIIGHLHLLNGPEPFFRKIGVMADRYGPAFMLRLGMRPTLVVSSWEVVRDCFTTNDRVLSSRPTTAAGKYMGYNYALAGLAPDGPYLRELKKVANLHLLSSTRLEILKHVWISEVDTRIKKLYVMWVQNDLQPVMVDMKRWFGSLVFTVIVRLVVGKLYVDGKDDAEAARFQEGISQFFHLATGFVLSDVVPFLEWMDFNGQLNAMKKNAKELDSIMESILQKHRQKRISGEAEDEDNFMKVLMSFLKDNKIADYDDDTVVKSSCLGLILGGTETTSVTLTGALTYTLNSRETLKKAQDELDSHIGKDRCVGESDIKNLPYIHAIIKETLRLAPAGPILAPHEAIEDCEVAGFHVPAGTQILVNIWKLHQDPRVWSKPSEFQPERFLGNHVDLDVRGQNFKFIPFGSGRRACLGISLTRQVMHLILARLFHGFDVATLSDAPIEMAEIVGDNRPMEVLLSPRLPCELYQ